MIRPGARVRETLNAKRETLLREIPLWVLLSLLLVGLALIAIVPKLIFPYSPADTRLASLSAVTGNVVVSDGIHEHAAQNGSLASREGRTILKTGEGNVSVKLKDGSIVILDSQSAIEFNNPERLAAGDAFVFNLTRGRLLIINSQDSRAPTQILIGGYFSAAAHHSIIGFEIVSSEMEQIRVDCLAGPCMVKNSIQLNSGQSVLIDKNEAMQLSLDVPYISWIALGKKGAYNSRLSSLFANLNPPVNATIITATPSASATASINPSNPTPVFTQTVRTTFTPTVSFTPTKTSPNWPIVSPTHSPEPRENPVATVTPTLPRTPTYAPLLTSTLKPSFTPTIVITIPPPTNTATLRPTNTATPLPTFTSTNTAIPTATLPEPTRTRRPTNTPRPTDTPQPTATNTPTTPPTSTPEPSATPLPTNTPEPTLEPSPTQDIIPTGEVPPG